MPSGTGNPTKDPPTGRRQTRRNSKRAVQSEAVSQDTSSQITKQGPMNRRGSPRKRNQHKNLTDSGQLQTAFLVSPLTSVTHLDTTSDGPHNRPGPASERIPIRGTSSRSSTIDQHTSATPKRNHRGLRPEQDASNLTTPIDFNSTPPVQAYAGPTFHASPAPSALPIPRLFSKSVPVGGKTTNMKAMVQDPSVETPSNKSDDSPTMRNAIQVNEGPVSEASPLDIFFNADRAEKARRTAAIAASSPLTRSPAYPVDIPQSVSPIPEYMRNHSRQNTGGSIGGGMFPLEMDASEKAASRHIPRPPLWESNRSELSPSRLSPEQAKAKTEAMKEILRISQTKENMPFVFSPAMPIPLHFDVGRRIVELEGYLNPEDPRYQPPEQHLNIRKVIDLYKTGTIAGGEQVCVCHGRIIPLEDLFRIKDWKWLEGSSPQRASKQAYGPSVGGNADEHFLLLEVRLDPEMNGDGTTLPITVLNDSGGDVLTLFDADLGALLANKVWYLGWLGYADVTNASGVSEVFPRLVCQVRFLRLDGRPWSEWIEEVAIVRPLGPGVSRLSGRFLRRSMYFGSGPGNRIMSVATTKGGMASLLD